MPLIPVGRLTVATPETMAASVRAGTEATTAVDERVNVQLASSPTVAAAAATAATAAAGPAVAAELSSAGALVGIPTSNPTVSPLRSLPVGFTNRTLNDTYADAYSDTYSGTYVSGSAAQGTVPLLDGSGRMIPAQMPATVALSDGTTPFSQVRIGDSVMLTEVRGARGHRLQFNASKVGEDYRPYMEVNAGDWDINGDVTAGYQVHVRGNGATPNSGSRVYWFLEAHGLTWTQNADPDYEGWYGMGVANRANGETPDGMGRAFAIGAGGRSALGFPFAKPHVQLLRNTAFTADDRFRPQFGAGQSQGEQATAPGDIHAGDLINFRREGHLGMRFLSVGDTPSDASRLFMSRARGTVTAATNVQSGDSLGGLDAGTVTGINPDYNHRNNNGTGTSNVKRTTARIEAVATENFTPTTAEGTRIDVQVTPNGSAARVTGLSVQEASTANDTSILIRVNKAGVVSQTRVEIGAADSGGAGYRMLRIPN